MSDADSSHASPQEIVNAKGVVYGFIFVYVLAVAVLGVLSEVIGLV